MAQLVRLSKLEPILAVETYPMSKAAAKRTFGDVRLDLADGTVSLRETIDQSQVTSFQSAADLLTELYQSLPRRAVGEPFQSEGDA